MYNNKHILGFGVLVLFLSLFGCIGGEEVIFDESATIDVGNAQMWGFDAEKGETISIKIDVTNGGPADVFILDSDGYASYNYNLGGGDESVYTIEHALGVKSYSKDFKTDTVGRYYVVVDNVNMSFAGEGTAPTGPVTVKARITAK